jgi:hypothetical protein
MAGTTRARHIADPLMIYNKITPYATARTMVDEIARNGRLLQSKTPYVRLCDKVYRQAAFTVGCSAASDRC